MEKGISVIYPQANKTIFEPDSWSFMLWKDIFVAPIVENSTTRQIIFPEGNNWINWWNNSQIFVGGSSVSLDYPLEQFPVFIREGAALVVNVTSSWGTGWGDEDSKGFLTVLIPKPTREGGYQAIREYRGISQEVWYSLSPQKQPSSIHLSLTATAHPLTKLIFLIRNLSAADDPKISVMDQIRGQPLEKISSKEEFAITSLGWRQDRETGDLWIKISDTSKGLRLLISSVDVRLP